VRQRKATLGARVNGDLALRFTADGLTSYSGLELLRHFLQQIHFSDRLRGHLRTCDPGSDYSSVAIVRLLLALVIVGGRRLRHLQHLAGDPIVLRFAGLAVLPTARTVGRWLSHCSASVRQALVGLNAEVIAESVRPMNLKCLTIDVDGTVCSTGLQVQWARRGYNPHRRKVPSYYPITALLAQTGHILRVKNRPGNIHDGKASMDFLRALVAQVRHTLGDARLEFRLDGAFFRREILSWLESRAEYAIKVPFYHWVGLKALIQSRRRWSWIGPDLQAFDTTVDLEPWDRRQRVVIYRKKVHHKSPKNYQLDLFDPSNGHWEYAAITTNKTIGMRALWHFMAGRGAHEKAIAELKTGLAFDTIPAQNYAANSAWQILVMLAHNLLTGFQIATRATRRNRTRKATALYDLKSVRTLRYELFNRAGILQHPEGRATLTLSRNLPTRRLFETIVDRLARAA
jgi:hypothetical protein